MELPWVLGTVAVMEVRVVIYFVRVNRHSGDGYTCYACPMETEQSDIVPALAHVRLY